MKTRYSGIFVAVLCAVLLGYSMSTAFGRGGRGGGGGFGGGGGGGRVGGGGGGMSRPSGGAVARPSGGFSVRPRIAGHRSAVPPHSIVPAAEPRPAANATQSGCREWSTAFDSARNPPDLAIGSSGGGCWCRLGSRPSTLPSTRPGGWCRVGSRPSTLPSTRPGAAGLAAGVGIGAGIANRPGKHPAGPRKW